jgi:hypothetical protein
MSRYEAEYTKAHSAITPDQAADRLLASGVRPDDRRQDAGANGAVHTDDSVPPVAEQAPELQGEPNSV